ncbi:HAMP domain-containing histidine kinase [Ideonella azotifigens]|uniref:histidine kinase n=1 Tax=Ideonella azotifigens TaxID=513160 RepID=A0ABN1KDS2_9BURK|nr:HAMP domain-containing sensor histidine kinase [Ideonella azotifigens]MCD2344516.1 HAMP domain-containing histidine kinase [Ideonella azotifigens]
MMLMQRVVERCRRHRAVHAARRWRHGLGHSLKRRLVFLFVLLAVGTTLVFLAGSREVFSTGWRELVKPLVSDYLDRLTAEIGSPPDIARAQALTQRLPISIGIDGPLVNWQSPNTPQDASDGRKLPHDASLRALLSRRTSDGHHIRYGIAAWQWQEHPRWFSGMTLGGLLVLTGLAFFYVRKLFRPLDDIRAGAMRYGTGDFSQPIPLRQHDELGELAIQVNAMAANLQRMLDGQRGLLLAISHELRSPLTRARLNAELVAEGPERQALLRDLAEMRDLIHDLLESERLARGHDALQREPVDLNQLLRDQVAQQCPEQPIEWQLDPTLPTLQLDRSRMQLLLRNLLDNALRHGSGGTLDLATHRNGQQLSLSVRDRGPGVPVDQRDRLAQPFYRPDAARTRRDGGVGLGLYLCRLVAESHGGTLKFEDAGPGLRVVVTLPVQG